MWDWEDAGGDYSDQLYQAWTNLKEILAAEWDGNASSTHPTKLEQDASGQPIPGKPRTYAITVPRRDWPTIFHRVPGLHLRNRQMHVDGEEVPAMIPALVIHALNNYESQKKNGSGIYFYVPKLETGRRHGSSACCLSRLEEAMGLGAARSRSRCSTSAPSSRCSRKSIQWVLRENLIGPNVGRWDYINSREDMFHHDPAMVIPESVVGDDDRAVDDAYTRRNALLALLAGAMPIGGMAAQMQNPRAPENDAKALRDIWFDKLRERLTGLSHQRHAARHLSPELGGHGRPGVRRRGPRAARHADFKDLQQRRRQDDGRGTRAARVARPAQERQDRAARARRADLTVEKLFAAGGATQLLRAPARADDRRRHAVRDVHGDRVHVSAAARQQRRGD